MLFLWRHLISLYSSTRLTKTEDAKSDCFSSRYLLWGNHSRDNTRARANLLVQLNYWNQGKVRQTIEALPLRLQQDKDWHSLTRSLPSEAPRELLCCHHHLGVHLRCCTAVQLAIAGTPTPESQGKEVDVERIQQSSQCRAKSSLQSEVHKGAQSEIGFPTITLKHLIKINCSYNLPPSKSHHSSLPNLLLVTCWGCSTVTDVEPGQPEMKSVSRK